MAVRYTTCPRCEAQWIGKRLCHCAACHKTFTGIGNFDTHRVGGHFVGTRRCMTDAEIEQAGLVTNQNGHYMTPALDKPAHWNKKEEVK